MSSSQSRLTTHANQSTGSYELALSAVVFGLAGWWLDRKLGISPALLITFSVLGFVGAGLAIFYRYRAHIARLQADTRAMQLAAESTSDGTGSATAEMGEGSH